MNGASTGLVNFGGKRIERNLVATDGRIYVAIHGTWYRTDRKLRKKQRVAARRAANAAQHSR